MLIRSLQDDQTKAPLDRVERIRIENQILRQKLADQGIKRVTIGAELEFDLPAEIGLSGPRRTAHADIRRKAISMELQEKAGHVSSARVGQYYAARAEVAARFLPREALMFDLIQDAAVGGWLQPLFGTKDPNGYYDSPGILELKTRPCDESVFVDRVDGIVSRLKKLSAVYGFPADCLGHIGLHINFGFYDKNGQNLFLDSGQDMSMARRIATGVAYALHAALPFLEHGRDQYPVGVHPGRGAFVRMAPGRMELRFHRRYGSLFLDAVSMVVMAGALYGLAPRNERAFREHVHQARLVQTPVVACLDHRMTVLRHILDGCILGDDGCLVPPRNHLMRNNGRTAESALEDMGFVPYCPELGLFESVDLCNKGVYLDAASLCDMIGRIRLEQKGADKRLVWPRRTTDEDAACLRDPARFENAFPLLGVRRAPYVQYRAEDLDSPRDRMAMNRALCESLTPVMAENLQRRPHLFLGARDRTDAHRPHGRTAERNHRLVS